MRRKGIYIYLTILLSTSGCTTNQNHLAVDTRVKSLCSAISNEVGTTTDSVVAAYGKPESIEILEVVNRHDTNFIDERTKLSYAGGFIAIYHAKSINRTFLEFARYSTKFKGKAVSPYIGISEKDLYIVLGEPDEVSENEVEYSCTFDGGFYLTFKMEHQSVNIIHYTVWID